MTNGHDELMSGATLTMTELARRREDAFLVVATGGYIRLTRNGRERMALVPITWAEERLAAKQGDANVNDEADGEDL